MPLRIALIASLTLAHATARAADSQEAERPAAETPAQKITVTGARDASDPLADRRESPTAKVIIGRDEIEKYGETTVGELLRRLPGVTVTGAPGTAGEVKMRGMGAGYTQVLVDGERMGGRRGRGAPIDMIPAEMIERIEIVRSSVAEFSAQAVAGTINIVLRDDAGKAQTRVRPVLAEVDGHVSPQLGVQNTGRAEGWSWIVAANANQRDQIADQMRSSLEYDAAGALESQTRTHREVTQQTRDASLAPRLTWRLDKQNQLNLQLFATHTESEAAGDESTQTLFGVPQAARAHETTSRERDLWRLNGGWRLRREGGDTLNLRLGFNGTQDESASQRQEYDGGGAATRSVDSDSRTREAGSSASLRWTGAQGESHTPGTGIEWTDSRRSEAQSTRENGNPVSGADGSTQAQREITGALYLQDEWRVRPLTTLTSGLRWELLHIHTQDSSGAPLRSDFDVLAPSLQLAHKMGESGETVMRTGLARTFRAPSLSELSGLVTPSLDNSISRPDRAGNPALDPETAWGLEWAVERYLDKTGLVSANLFYRWVSDLIRRELSQGSDGRWLSKPINEGSARVSGIELEWKLSLANLLPPGHALQLNGNYTASRTRDSSGAKIDDQPGQTANIGLEWQPAESPLKLGGNLNWAPAYEVKLSDGQTRWASAKTTFDAFAAWTLNRDALLRLSANNLTGWGGESRTQASANNTPVSDESTEVAGLPTWQLALELKF
ncbi:TonB-dependent receptor [Niveibacterium sp. 24ML]|uniref:TonB-dependent receptor plug domain-containing protein n=1 Tax=Niveibacterium sp. 24ML TaxID=2985512 RepID=UPI00226D6893|nr:TonB-dependent receptor [Niveibacterium sp. 24ML]MCX9155853.1 TonB-dependent receptor [Niveibacterium sp. 24ML]